MEDVLYVSINSGGSNTHSAALMARQNFLEEHPGCLMHITIVDSRTYSMGYGWFVCEAARKLAGGADMRTVAEYLKDAFARLEITLSVFTLKFIKKAGAFLPLRPLPASFWACGLLLPSSTATPPQPPRCAATTP